MFKYLRQKSSMFIFTWLTLCFFFRGEKKTRKMTRKWRNGARRAQFYVDLKKNGSRHETGIKLWEGKWFSTRKNEKSSNLFCWLWFRVALCNVYRWMKNKMADQSPSCSWQITFLGKKRTSTRQKKIGEFDSSRTKFSEKKEKNTQKKRGESRITI